MWRRLWKRKHCLFSIVGAIFYGMSGEEGFFPCHPRSILLPEIFPSLTFAWEDEGSAERAGGDGGQLPVFDRAVGSCSLLLPLFHMKDVLRYARSFVSPLGHSEADINDVFIVEAVAVFGQVI